jgi:hypothetical protein
VTFFVRCLFTHRCIVELKHDLAVELDDDPRAELLGDPPNPFEVGLGDVSFAQPSDLLLTRRLRHPTRQGRHRLGVGVRHGS